MTSAWLNYKIYDWTPLTYSNKVSHQNIYYSTSWNSIGILFILICSVLLWFIYWSFLWEIDVRKLLLMLELSIQTTIKASIISKVERSYTRLCEDLLPFKDRYITYLCKQPTPTESLLPIENYWLQHKESYWLPILHPKNIFAYTNGSQKSKEKIGCGWSTQTSQPLLRYFLFKTSLLF